VCRIKLKLDQERMWDTLSDKETLTLRYLIYEIFHSIENNTMLDESFFINKVEISLRHRKFTQSEHKKFLTYERALKYSNNKPENIRTEMDEYIVTKENNHGIDDQVLSKEVPFRKIKNNFIRMIGDIGSDVGVYGTITD